jgi:hypothetical protein
LAKEEAEAKRLAEWAVLDEETKFFRTFEDPQKEPRIIVENKVATKVLKQLEEQVVALGEPTEVNAG